MILISIQKANAFQKSMDLESIDLARWGSQAACPHPCCSGVQPALHTWPWASSLFLSLSRPKFPFQLQPVGTRGTWKGFGDQCGRMLEKFKTKFYTPQRLTGFTYLSLFWPFFWNQELSAKMRFQVPTKFRGYSNLVCAHF